VCRRGACTHARRSARNPCEGDEVWLVGSGGSGGGGGVTRFPAPRFGGLALDELERPVDELPGESVLERAIKWRRRRAVEALLAVAPRDYSVSESCVSIHTKERLRVRYLKAKERKTVEKRSVGRVRHDSAISFASPRLRSPRLGEQ
jgi:hypothetical protein